MTPLSLFLPLVAPLCGAREAACTGAPAGRYVEARTASVFAGACHYGGEAATAGREALLAWRIERGSFAGVDLAGVEIAALVAAERNLAEPGPRRALVRVDAQLDAARARAALLWLATTRRGALGDVLEVELGPLEIAFEGDGYRVRGAQVPEGASFDLDGATLADRACCAMPQDVWYRPFEALEGRLVGLDARFRASSDGLGVRFARAGDNEAFTGSFGAR
jgi:hypothetical protein